MIVLPDHPLDALADCVRKAAFLADALTFASETRHHQFSDPAMQGLACYIGELEHTLKHIDTTLTHKEEAV